MTNYVCESCGKPVKNKTNYDLFERMHWICFHYEFEHETFDRDEPCTDPGCLWNQIAFLKKILKNNKVDFDKEMQVILRKKHLK